MNNYKTDLHLPHASSLLAALLVIAALLGPIGFMAARVAGY